MLVIVSSRCGIPQEPVAWRGQTQQVTLGVNMGLPQFEDLIPFLLARTCRNITIRSHDKSLGATVYRV